MENYVSEQLSSFIDLLVDAVCVVDEESRFVFVSASFEAIFGYKPEEVIGKAMIGFVAPEDRDRTLAAAGEIMLGKPKQAFENRYITKDGRKIDIMWSARWSPDKRMRFAVARDITERKRHEAIQAALYAISEAAHVAIDLDSLFEHIHTIVGRLLPASNFTVALWDGLNNELQLSYNAESVESTDEDSKALVGFCQRVISEGSPFLLSGSAIKDPLYQTNGRSPELVCCLGVPLESAEGPIGALVLRSYSPGCNYSEEDKDLLQFVSRQVATAVGRKQLHERLQYLAQYDELTGLPTRALLYDRLDHALARTRRQKGRMAVLYLDLDKFKEINDSFGHEGGDALLQEIARRLKGSVRDSDTVARMGGDEFVVLLENAPCGADIFNNIRKISEAIAAPATIDGNIVRVQASIGVAVYPDNGDNRNALLRCADKSMYESKKTQKCGRDLA